jgi:hypothetical protein
MTSAGFERAIPATKRLHTYALDSKDTAIGTCQIIRCQNLEDHSANLCLRNFVLI